MENEWRRFLCSFKFLSHFTLILKIPLSPYHNEMQPIQQWMQANASLSNRCTCTYVNMNKMFKYFASNWTVFCLIFWVFLACIHIHSYTIQGSFCTCKNFRWCRRPLVCLMRISPAEDWVLADEGAGVECERSSGLPGAQVYIKFSWEIEEIEFKFNLEK